MHQAVFDLRLTAAQPLEVCRTGAEVEQHAASGRLLQAQPGQLAIEPGALWQCGVIADDGRAEHAIAGEPAGDPVDAPAGRAQYAQFEPAVPLALFQPGRAVMRVENAVLVQIRSEE